MPARRAVHPRIIETDDDIKAGIKALRLKCPVVRHMHDRTGLPPLRRRASGFEGLARIVVGQQLSVASAAAIWSRTEQVLVPFQPSVLLDIPDATLRSAGLSAGKVRTLQAIARAVVVDGLDLDGFADSDDGEVHAALTAISGIGPWTADVYLMFCLGRADAFAPGDLALQVALQMATGMDARPTAKDLAAFAESWRPWRSVAARLLWAYYKVEKDSRSGVPV